MNKQVVYIFRIGQLGDSLVALPAIHVIKSRHEGAKIILITNKPAQSSYISAWDVYQHAGIFDDVIFYEKSFLKLRSLWKIIKSTPDTTLYYLTPSRNRKSILRDKLFFRNLCGIKSIICMEHACHPEAQRDKSGKLLVLEKEYDRLLRMVAATDNEKSVLELPFLRPSCETRQNVCSLLSHVPKQATLIAIGHGSKMPAKKWPLKYYIELCCNLSQARNDIHFIFLGGKEDYEEGQQALLALESKQATNLCGATSIIESAEVLAHCRIYIGNDTGTMHLASIMGTRCVAVFSARDNPGQWEPYGDNNTIIRKEVDCDGCMLTECKEHQMKCLTEITADQILSLAAKALAETSNQQQKS